MWTGDNQADWSHIARLLKEWEPDALIVGLPLNMDNSENPMTVAAKKFGNRLKGRYNLPIHMVDERLTSNVAKNTLVDAGISLKYNKAAIDKLAAQLILQAFLNEEAHENMKATSDNRHTMIDTGND